jgi:hypothetical protein
MSVEAKITREDDAMTVHHGAGGAALTLAPDAAIALGIAATAMPFARTPAGEAERWLRVLRLHGEAGVALQALGVSEGPAEDVGAHHEREPVASSAPDASRAGTPGFDAPERDPVAQVIGRAAEIASRQGAAGVGTKDLLLAVMEIYGEEFDRVLHIHGTDRSDVLERLT